MCNQAVCLVAAELERRGISTVALVLLRPVAEAVRPPRALCLPFRHGYPLDRPNDPARQHGVLDAALRLLEDPALRAPALVEYSVPGGP
jgi:D-proline reductase (dithiol) PrdB